MLPKLKKPDMVFYDLQLVATLWPFHALFYGMKKANLIAFEPIEESSKGALIVVRRVLSILLCFRRICADPRCACRKLFASSRKRA